VAGAATTSNSAYYTHETVNKYQLSMTHGCNCLLSLLLVDRITDNARLTQLVYINRPTSQQSYCASGKVRTGTGDHLQAKKPSHQILSHPEQLSLAIPSWLATINEYNIKLEHK